MEKDIITRLSEDRASFSKSQRSIADYICENCDKAAFMTAEMLSRAAGVSESTVVRFATELGYEGYPGLRRALQYVLRDRLLLSRQISEPDGVSPAVEEFRKSLNSSSEEIKTAGGIQNEMGLENIISAVLSAKTAYIAGYGIYEPMAAYMEYCFYALKQNVCRVSGRMYGRLRGIDSGDVLIQLCGDMAERDGVGMARLARDMGASVICFCTGEQSPVLKYADYRMFAAGSTGLTGLVEAVSAAIAVNAGINISAVQEEIKTIHMEYDTDGQD